MVASGLRRVGRAGSGSGPLPLPLWLLNHHLAGRRCVVPRCVRARPGGCLALRAPRLGFPLPTKGTPRAVFTRGLVAFLCCNFEASSLVALLIRETNVPPANSTAALAAATLQPAYRPLQRSWPRLQPSRNAPATLPHLPAPAVRVAARSREGERPRRSPSLTVPRVQPGSGLCERAAACPAS